MNQDIREYKQLVELQGELMEHLYDSPEIALRKVCKSMQCTQIIILICDERGMVESSLYDSAWDSYTERNDLVNGRLGNILRIKKEIFCEVSDMEEDVVSYVKEWGIESTHSISCFSGENNQCLYAAILCHEDPPVKSRMHLENVMMNNLQVCLENRVYHRIVTFESEHDTLTGLYNRRCYFKRSQEEYPKLASIGVFYFDVNNLKLVNDRDGHDAGDALLQKAAESIRQITCDTIHGYRMGGDEFIAVCMNCTKKDVETIKSRWEAALEKVNEKYGGNPCSIAVGSAYAKGGIDIEEVCKAADKRMYQDKIRKKSAQIGL